MSKHSVNWGAVVADTVDGIVKFTLNDRQRKSISRNMDKWVDDIEDDQRRRIVRFLISESAKDGLKLDAVAALVKAAKTIEKDKF